MKDVIILLYTIFIILRTFNLVDNNINKEWTLRSNAKIVCRVIKIKRLRRKKG